MIDPKKIAAVVSWLEAMHDEATKTAEGPQWSDALDVVRALLSEREEREVMLRAADKAFAWCLRRDPLASPAAAWRLRLAALTGRSAPEKHYEPDRREELLPASEREELLSLLREIDEDLVFCPVCEIGKERDAKGRLPTERHAPDCRLAAFLGPNHQDVERAL